MTVTSNKSRMENFMAHSPNLNGHSADMIAANINPKKKSVAAIATPAVVAERGFLRSLPCSSRTIQTGITKPSCMMLRKNKNGKRITAATVMSHALGCLEFRTKSMPIPSQ